MEVYVVIVNDVCDYEDIFKCVGVYKDLETAISHLNNTYNRYIKDWESNFEKEDYTIFKSDMEFSIYENGEYTKNHTCCLIDVKHCY